MSLHIPVLLADTLEMFRPVKFAKGWLLDGTFGRGGHSIEILKRYPDSRIIALDCDAEAIEYAQKTYADWMAQGRLEIHRLNFSDFQQALQGRELVGALLDLGVSSPQLDQAERGFSFYKDGPLDMRMDTNADFTAADIVNTWEDRDLVALFQNYGEIRRPHRVVNAIVADRKKQAFTRTQPLSEMMARVDGWRKKGHHPATNYFLALRIAVNAELDRVTEVLSPMADALLDGGRLAVITFHSLEDRIVKAAFRKLAADGVGVLVNKKVIQASDEESRSNPRARSAKLRGFEKGVPPQMSRRDYAKL